MHSITKVILPTTSRPWFDIRFHGLVRVEGLVDGGGAMLVRSENPGLGTRNLVFGKPVFTTLTINFHIPGNSVFDGERFIGVNSDGLYVYVRGESLP